VCGGFPCTDLSVAGKREGLDAARSGLYHEMIRIVSESQPQYVVFENVPPLLKYRGRVDTDLRAWLRHDLASVRGIRRWSATPTPARLCRRRARSGRVADAAEAVTAGRLVCACVWLAVQAAALWPTPTTGDHATMYQQGGEPLGHAARWPTPMASGLTRLRDDGWKPNAAWARGGRRQRRATQKIEATTTAQPVCFWPCLARLAVRRFLGIV
jgi:hypothetical protein